jgi:putative flippase GtrA
MSLGQPPRSRLIAGLLALAGSRFSRFALVGCAGLVVDVATLTAVHTGLGLDPYSARIPAFLVAATATWALNRRLTFADQTTGSVGEWLRYLAANGVGGAVNLATYMVLISSGLALFTRWPQIAVGVGSIAGLVFNFTASRRYVFGRA